MHVEQLVQYLDSPEETAQWMRSLGIRHTLQAHKCLVDLSGTGLTADLLAAACTQLNDHLHRNSDPDMALVNLTKFVRASRNPISLGSLFERDHEALPILLQLFSTSQYLADVMFDDPESFDLLRMTEGMPVTRADIVREMRSEVEPLSDPRAIMRLLRMGKRRETLRIAYGDIITKQPLETVAEQNSLLAEAICEAAVRSIQLKLEKRFGVPRNAQQQQTRFVVMGVGRLGGRELDYSGEIKLFFVYEVDGKTSGPKSLKNREYFERLVEEFLRMLSESTDLGSAYQVDQRLRPHGSYGSLVNNREETIQYFDTLGRTWERQAIIKARPIAGDLEFGRELMCELEPWVFHRYLNRSDITELKALKRRLEKRTHGQNGELRDIKDGHGGIRDIEFVIQFLQLLNGGDVTEVRAANTLEAINRLEQCGCLTPQEGSLLEENYRFLRKIEHRLQILVGLGKNALPENDDDLNKLAIRMGYTAPDSLAVFKHDLQQKSSVNRKIIDHLLHDAFGDDSAATSEIDLVFDPDPTEQFKQQVLGPYQFQDVSLAYKNMMTLAEERIPFLSTRRCRHFVAAISSQLLTALALTPNPDTTLTNLCRVSDSLGGKGVLWELFSYNPPSLQLYIKLCAASPYLAGILQNQPGMIDELMDSLVLNRLPSRRSMRADLNELIRGAEDPEMILHSFKHAQYLRVGVHDLLERQDIRATTIALSDIAEVCLQQVVCREYNRLRSKYGTPTRKSPTGDVPCELILLALGDLGGREANYHSNLDLLFLYEESGFTKHERHSKSRETTTNQHFYEQLSQRVVGYVNRVGSHGRLFELDARLRPTGKTGSLVVLLSDLRQYLLCGDARLSDRQALCRARPINGSARVQDTVNSLIQDVIGHAPWTHQNTTQLVQMRRNMENTGPSKNLKRSKGGILDIEYLVQMLQMAHAAKQTNIITVGIGESLTAIEKATLLSTEVASGLRAAYQFLRCVEARLQLMDKVVGHNVPEADSELETLTFLMDYENHRQLTEQIDHTMQYVRQQFNEVFAQ